MKRAVVVGGGSAGYLSAIALRRKLPELDVCLIRSPDVPVIGVGESTTSYLPSFLHDTLRLDRKAFYAAVEPSWKMGVRFHWGAKQDTHFNYSFDLLMNQVSPLLRKQISYYCMEDWSDGGPFSAGMDRGLSPCYPMQNGSVFVQPNAGYHIENSKFLMFLQHQAGELGVEDITGHVAEVGRSGAGDVTSLTLTDGRVVGGDLFVDCSGFRSVLLEKEMGERYVSYSDTLFCDSAIVGGWKSDGDVKPYTTADTMDHGWCWKIEFLDHITRGYVYSSRFCDADQAMREFQQKNPQVGDDMKEIRFKSGRYENFWSKNVVAIGNSSGFVEPLEATALHLIAEQISMMCGTLRDSDFRIVPETLKINNHYYRERWDDVRNFLALHYKYNQKSDTPFWIHCREETSLHEIEGLVEYYSAAGLSVACHHFIPRASIFSYNGYMILLIEQRVPTRFKNGFSEADRRAWDKYRGVMRERAMAGLPIRRAMKIVNSPDFQWS